MRGAILLFLSWLFWESGGISWDSNDPSVLVDQGGLTFLKKMEESPNTGLECISGAYGAPVNSLFNEFLGEIHDYRLSNKVYNYKSDPLTGEAVDFFANMSGANALGFPKTNPSSTPVSLAPWSFVFLDQFTVQNNNFLTLESSKTNGSSFFAWSVK